MAQSGTDRHFRGSIRIALAAAILSLAGSRARATLIDQGEISAECQAARCAVQAQIDQACPCDSATSHVAYINCVLPLVIRLIPIQCQVQVFNCAVNSTCGLQGFQTCDFDAVGDGVPDPDDIDPGICQIQKPNICVAIGGTPTGTGSCCPICPAQTTTTSTTRTTTTTSTTRTTTTTSTS